MQLIRRHEVGRPNTTFTLRARGRFTAEVAVGRGNEAHIHAAYFGGARSLDFRFG